MSSGAHRSGGRSTCAALLAAALVAAGCASSHRTASGPTTSATSAAVDTGGAGGLTVPSTLAGGAFPAVDRPAASGRLAKVPLRVTPLAKVDTPLELVARPGHPDQLFVGERPGRVVLAHPSGGSERFSVDTAHPLLDISPQVGTDGEEGLLGLAFDRSGRTLYLSYDVPSHDSRVVSYPVVDRPSGPTVDVARAKLILAVDQPDQTNHKGGDLVLGPDGYLYVGFGDGGSENDPDAIGQNPRTMLSKILRLDPAHPSAGRAYGIPRTNPYADGEGGLPETWVSGLRNPWRFSFDPATGDLWIGDVGQNSIEEIDRLPAGKGAGANFGWSGYEGTHVFRKDRLPASSVPPVYEMSHDTGVCAVTGGVVYHGSAIPALRGAYVFADACHRGIAALRSDGSRAGPGKVTDVAWLSATRPAVQVVSIGTDAAGEIYLLGLGGQIWRLDPA